MGLMVALFKRLKLNEAVVRNDGWKELENRGTLMLGKTGRHYRCRTHRSKRRQTARRLGMKVLGYDPYVKPETVASLGIKMVSASKSCCSSRIW